MLKNTNAQIYLFFLIIFLGSCRQGQRIDVSHIDLDIKITRFDQSMDSLENANIAQKNEAWLTQYGYFYADYMQYMLEAGNPLDTARLIPTLQEIIATEDYQALSSDVAKVFPDLTMVEQELTQAFKLLKYHFEEIKVPARFFSFFSGFSVQVPMGQDYMGIGLDMFLGADSRFYPALRGSIPLYISRRFTPENIVPRVMESYLRETLYPQHELDATLLEHMVYQGKILYLMDQVMPDVSDSLKIGFTNEQLAWARHHEREIWAWFLQENLLYESDYNRIQRYFGEAPFTPELGENNESAPKLGSYIGWQIVRKYAERHPDTTPQELLHEADAQQLLEKARYRGR